MVGSGEGQQIDSKSDSVYNPIMIDHVGQKHFDRMVDHAKLFIQSRTEVHAMAVAKAYPRLFEEILDVAQGNKPGNRMLCRCLLGLVMWEAAKQDEASWMFWWQPCALDIAPSFDMATKYSRI
jgi:hypothetical protein